MKKNVLLTVAMAVSAWAGVMAQGLMISEYAEGASFNKAIELYNSSDATIDLSGYKLQKDSNGADTFTEEFALTGTLASGDVIVISREDAAETCKPVGKTLIETSKAVINFNGDDPIRLVTVEGTVVDFVGVIGDVDFGKDVTLRRLSTITVGSASYDVAQWESLAKDTHDGLGVHVCNLPAGGTTPVDPVETVLPEITGFTALTSATIDTDMNIMDMDDMEASDLLPDSIELLAADTSVLVAISSWSEDVVFDGATVATYTFTPSVAIPAAFTDTTATDFTAAMSIEVTVAQTYKTLAVVSSIDDNFDNAFEGWLVNQVDGVKGWYCDTYDGGEWSTSYAKINTYGEGVNDSWLISAPVNLDALTAPVFTFEVASYNASKTIADCGAEQFEVYYSTTYVNGPIVSTEWTRFTNVDNLTLVEKWDFVAHTEDLSSISGAAVSFAFRHKSDATNGTTWEVDNVYVGEKSASSIGETKIISNVYTTSGLINIQTQGEQTVTVYDFSGRVMQSQTINTTAAISVASGVYLVKVGNEVTKVAVQ